MQWFGQSWDAPVCRECQQAPTPVGSVCEWCQEPIAEGDNGFLIPGVLIPDYACWHYECHLRGVIGSINHLLRDCSCYRPGASDTDPPQLTRRQAARLAVAVWESRWYREKERHACG